MGSVTTFGAFTAARLGMYASMKGLDVTGHNIANINTRGYSRQVLDQRALKLNGADRYYSQNDARVGTGVLTTGISQLRDPYLDIRYRNENASVGAADAQLGVLEDLAKYIDEIAKNKDGDGVLEKSMADLIQQLQKLNKGVGQQENDSLVRATAQSLTALLKSYATSLEGVEKDTIDGFDADITRVNEILSGIQTLNDSIRNNEIHGDKSPELRDDRNLLLDELSQYVKINVTYETEDLGGGLKVQKLKVTLADDNETMLIDGQYAGKMSVVTHPTPNTDPATSGAFPYLDSNGNPTDDVTQAKQFKDKYYDLQVSPLTNRNGKLHPTADTTVALDESLKGALQATRQMLGAAGAYRSADNPFSSTMRGIPFYRNSLDSLANQLATVLNDINNPYQVDTEGNYLDATGAKIASVDDPAKFLNKNNKLSATDQVELEREGHRIGGPLFSTDNGQPFDPNKKITAGNISISQEWSTGAVQIVASAVKDAGSTDSTNIAHMILAFSTAYDYKPTAIDPNAESSVPMFSCSFQQMLGRINSTLASDVNTTTASLNSYITTADSIAGSRESVSGVDLNDEAANMMMYQKSYSAACRLMTTIDEALDKLINGTGVVGR